MFEIFCTSFNIGLVVVRLSLGLKSFYVTAFDSSISSSRQ